MGRKTGLKSAWVWIITIAATGCGRSDQTTPAPTSGPATTTTPSTLPAGPGKLVLGEETLVFPPSRLTIQARPAAIEAVLISQGEGVNDDDKPNAVFLQLNLDLPDGDSLLGATAAFKATSRERVDSIQGIMLTQRQWVLQPYDMQAEIIGERSPVVVKIRGAFLLFDDTTEPDIPQQVEITAEFPAELTVRSTAAEQ